MNIEGKLEFITCPERGKGKVENEVDIKKMGLNSH